MARKQFWDIAKARRDRLLNVAAAEFSEWGYEAASVNRIIAEAGTSKGSLYYYFEDKEDLFATVLERAMDRMLEETGRIHPESLTADTFWNSFRDMMRRSVSYLQDNKAYVRLARSFHQLRRSAPESAATRRLMELGTGYVRTLLERGQAVGVVRTDLPLPLLVEAAMAVDEAGDRWMVQHWDEYTDQERIAHGDAQIDLIRDMLHAKNQGWEE